jgi:hypothetical protein
MGSVSAPISTDVVTRHACLYFKGHLIAMDIIDKSGTAAPFMAKLYFTDERHDSDEAKFLFHMRGPGHLVAT